MSLKLRQSGDGFRVIVQNGEEVGTLTNSGGVAWVKFKGQFGARFKYRKPVSSAKDFIKFVCKEIGVDQYLKELNAEDRPAPLEVARRYGYESLNAREVKKENGVL